MAISIIVNVESPTLSQVESYLCRSKWKKVRTVGKDDCLAIWQKGPVSVLLPNDERIDDYDDIVSEAISKISAALSLQPMDVYHLITK